MTPMPLVGSAFPGDDGQDSKRSLAAWAMGSAHDGSIWEDRLGIGFKDAGFGVVSLRRRQLGAEETWGHMAARLGLWGHPGLRYTITAVI